MPISGESIEMAAKLRRAVQRLHALPLDNASRVRQRDTLVDQGESLVRRLVEQEDTSGLLDLAGSLLDDIKAFSGDPTTEP